MKFNQSELDRLTFWKHVVEAYQTCHQKYSRMMSHFDLTPSQFDVMLGIEGLGDSASPKAIAKGLLVTKGNITSVTRRLHERGLILQEAHAEDKRSIVLKLTPDGKALLTKAKQAAKEFVQQQLSPFSEDQVEIVGSLMKQMRGHLESQEFDLSINETISKINIG